jgi:4-hydroxy-tetrahydrodipicolinate synthase
MIKKIPLERLSGVWSATPTPFTAKMDIDLASVKRLIEHHVRLGIKGLFLAGTCGEGPVMPDRMRNKFVQAVAEYNRGRMLLAVQVTDNSSGRIVDNITEAKKHGADIAVIAPPYFVINNTPEAIAKLYLDAIRQSALPVGIYDRGHHSSVYVPDEAIKQIYAEKNVIMIKDSSADFDRMKLALAARKKRPSLRLLTGWEFKCIPYLTAKYDGLLLGGGIFNGYIANEIIKAVEAGDAARAERLQNRMNRLMWDVYGGKKIACWMSGLKKLLVDMGIFSTWKNFYDYPLHPSCIKAITKVLKKDADILFPWKSK